MIVAIGAVPCLRRKKTTVLSRKDSAERNGEGICVEGLIKRTIPRTREACSIRRKNDVKNIPIGGCGNNDLFGHRERYPRWRAEGRRPVNHKNHIAGASEGEEALAKRASELHPGEGARSSLRRELKSESSFWEFVVPTCPITRSQVEYAELVLWSRVTRVRI